MKEWEDDQPGGELEEGPIEKCQNAMGRAGDQAAQWLDIVRRGGQRDVWTPPGWEDDAEDAGVEGGSMDYNDDDGDMDMGGDRHHHHHHDVMMAAGASSSLPDADSIPREKVSFKSKLSNAFHTTLGNPFKEMMVDMKEMDMDFFVTRYSKCIAAVVICCLLLVSLEVVVMTASPQTPTSTSASASSSAATTNTVVAEEPVSSPSSGGGGGGEGLTDLDIIAPPPPSPPSSESSTVTVGNKPPSSSSSSSSSANTDIYILNNAGTSSSSLPSDERVAEIQTKLELISGPSIKKVASYQNKAANWILHQDAFQLSPRSPYLIQRYVLALVYFALNGDSWRWGDKKGEGEEKWLDGQSGECTWVGVECNDDAFVVILDLDSFGLNGQLPKEVAELRYITQLYLNNNKISGQIPNEWGHMTKLEQLLLDSNYIFGNVPPSICNLHDTGVLQVITTDCSSEVQSSVSCSCCMNCPDSYTNTPNGGAEGASIAGGSGGAENTATASGGSSTSGTGGTMDKQYYTRSIDIAARVGEVSGILAGQAGTPQNEAMMWILDQDAQQLDEDDPHLLQRYILATLYFGTEGENWSYSSWLSGDARECSYPGVKCNEDGDVTVLSLSASNLKGPVPRELSFLHSLKSLDLSDNSIVGEVPVEFSNMENIQKLLLYDNDITGSISEKICNLPSLSQIWVDCDTSPPKVSCSCCSNCAGSTTTITSSASVQQPGYSENTQNVPSEAVIPNTEAVVPEENWESAAEAIDVGEEFTYNDPNFTPNKLTKPSEVITSNEPTPPTNVAAPNEATIQDAAPSQPVASYVAPSGNRADAITSKITSVLNYVHAEALDWIIAKDSKQLNADNAHLVQRYIMALLYFNMDGDNWTKKAKWLSGGSDECDWEGVECDNMNRVTSIILKSGNLEGPIPSVISELDQLKVLDLSDNKVGRSIPDSLGNLASLAILFLHGNEFKGEVPSDICALRQEGQLEELWVDCEGANPKVKCSCCTRCGAQ